MDSAVPQHPEAAGCVHWLLGLGFDCVGVEEARRRIFQAVAMRTKLVFATPNVNFLAEANRDSAFRKSILSTQLSLVDGMPLVWLGRLLGVPFTQRVAGSSLVERLRRHEPGPSLRVFFFGGNPEVARRANQELARANGPMIAAGYYDPGFVSIEEMSRPEIIDAINAAKPDMIIVSLGAKKGHFWIDRNRNLLEAPVISHLGAAVGYVSGDLRRAPEFLQRTGLEWLWRTAMEPRLAMRYARDAGFLASAMVSSVVPTLLRRAWRRGTTHSRFKIELVSDDSRCRVINVWGSLRASNLSRLSGYVAAIPAGKHLVVDLSRLTDFDPISVGHLYVLRYRSAVPRVTFTCADQSRGSRLLAEYRAQCLTWRPESTQEPGPDASVVPSAHRETPSDAHRDAPYESVGYTSAKA